MCEIPHLIDVFPLEDLSDRVRSRYEEQVSIRAGLADVAQRVDRVGRSITLDVNAANCESRVSRSRDHRHEVAMLPLGHFGFHPGLARGNEDDLVEVELLLYLARGYEVAVVDGIERSTH